METEKFELMLDEAQANAALEKGMLYADTFVNKNYLINLDRYPLVELDPAEKSDEYIRLYQIERIVYDVDEPKMKESLIDIAVRQYHVSVSDASVYINHYCEYMGYALPENKIVCGLCGTENPAGTTNCVKCGKPLIIPCPACSAENNNSAKVCAKCGFDLTKMDKAVELLRQAKQKYSEKALEEAERLVKEAKAYIVKMLDAHIAMRKDYALYLRIYADTFLNKAISPSDYQYERNESLSDDELLYYNEIQEILKSINAQMSKHEIDHCKGIVI